MAEWIVAYFGAPILHQPQGDADDLPVFLSPIGSAPSASNS